MGFGPPSNPLDFADPCVRAFWSAIVPAFFVFALCVSKTPVRAVVPKIGLFEPFLTLKEAEGLDLDDSPRTDEVNHQSIWPRVLFIVLGLVEALSWLSYGAYVMCTSPSPSWCLIAPFLISFSWMYTLLFFLLRPVSPTPSFSLFAFYLLQLAFSVLLLGGLGWDYVVVGNPLDSWEAWVYMGGMAANVVVVATLVGVLGSMPIAVPGKNMEKEDIVRLQSLLLLLPSLSYECHWVGPHRLS